MGKKNREKKRKRHTGIEGESAARKSTASSSSSSSDDDLDTRGSLSQMTAWSKSSTSILHPGKPLTSDELQRRKERQARFGLYANNDATADPSASGLRASRTSSTTTAVASSAKHNVVAGDDQQQLIGENQNLEKPYLRLTTFPRKEDVRPLSVLKRSLDHIKARYKENEDFAWANEQLKSVRQDITVQGIRNSFVLSVYETHARILLEHGDLNEFNQCQTMIRSLTEGTVMEDSNGDDEETVQKSKSSRRAKKKRKQQQRHCKPLQQTPQVGDEFRAYAILYAIVQRSWMQLKKELMRVQQPILGGEAPTSSSGPNRNEHTTASQHALDVLLAVEEHNYHAFFALYDSAPHMSVYLMDFMLKRVRVGAYERIVSAFRPTITVKQLQEWMGFTDDTETELFLKERGAILIEKSSNNGEGPLLDCKACCVPLSG